MSKICNAVEISKKNLLKRLEEVEEEIKTIQKDIQDENDKVNIEDINLDLNQDTNENTAANKDENVKTNDDEEDKENKDFTQYKLDELQQEFKEIMDQLYTEEGVNNIKENAVSVARHYITNKHMERLKDCYAMEKTPLGNVLMVYDIEKSSFKYYSDATIPYRYLEPVGRKYVKLFHCRPLFIDMEEELKLFEEKWEKRQNEKLQEQAKEQEQQQKQDIQNTEENHSNTTVSAIKETKKNVFTKFKSYNREGASGKVNIAAPPKNNIPNTNTVESKENEKVLLKEKANKYVYEGKFANFNFLKKIQKSVCNKKLNLTFADFKKMQK